MAAIKTRIRNQLLYSYYKDRRQSESYNFKEIAKISNFGIFLNSQHATHLRILVDKMCKYENPVSILEDRGRTRLCPQTDGRTDGQTDGHGQVNPSPLNFVEAEGIKPFALHIGSIIIQLCHNYTHTTAAIVICANYYLIGWRESKLKQNFTIFHMSFIIFELFTHKAFLQWLLNVCSSFVFVADRDMQIYCCLCLFCLW